MSGNTAPRAGRFGSHSDSEESRHIAAMVSDVRANNADYVIWKDWLVMGDYDEGQLQEVIVARIVRRESA